MPMPFHTFFSKITGAPAPYSWQQQLGSDPTPRNRLIRIPTGFGKTAGVVVPWLYHRVQRQDLRWPTRLVLTLPMRVLVEQTLREIEAWVQQLGSPERVGVFPLMGGLLDKEFAATPEHPAVLVGTQDMILSRALMRGYAAARGRWPIDFGLLQHDALLVLDEVQLMDVGLATSTQMAAFHSAEQPKAVRPHATWWMSATLRPDWLRSVDHRAAVDPLVAEQIRIPATERSGGLWTVRKPLTRAPSSDPKDIARLVSVEHRPGSLSLVVVNRVDRAVEVARALSKDGCTAEVRLVHSRFRPHERSDWASSFLRRGAALPAEGRIIVATQVVEAGVDISAQLLVTELAPWASLVQRFGRAARYAGEQGSVVVVGEPPEDDKAALPYAAADVRAAHEALQDLDDVSPATLEAFDDALPAAVASALYRFEPEHVLRRPDFDELFDTTPDLTGVDLDVSRFIRSGDTRDITVFWREIEAEPRTLSLRAQPLPGRTELCPVPLGPGRKWLEGKPAWRLSYVHGHWERIAGNRLAPGMVVLLAARTGGYDPAKGWTPASKPPVTPVFGTASPAESALDRASATAADEDLSTVSGWKTIATHGAETASCAREIGEALGLAPALVELLALAGRWHDYGKSHPAFQGKIASDARTARFDSTGPTDLAKAPREAWHRSGGPGPAGFRHELASALALLQVLAGAAPDHPALSAPWAAVLNATGTPRISATPDLAAHPLATEIAALSEESFDLLLWLVVTHHGKIRAGLVAGPRDEDGRIAGVAHGDELPSLALLDSDSRPGELPPLTLDLGIAQLGLHPFSGRSWAERVDRLVRTHGPFRLAFLEALLRAADVRASRLLTEDPRL